VVNRFMKSHGCGKSWFQSAKPNCGFEVGAPIVVKYTLELITFSVALNPSEFRSDVK